MPFNFYVLWDLAGWQNPVKCETSTKTTVEADGRKSTSKQSSRVIKCDVRSIHASSFVRERLKLTCVAVGGGVRKDFRHFGHKNRVVIYPRPRFDMSTTADTFGPIILGHFALSRSYLTTTTNISAQNSETLPEILATNGHI